MEKKYVTLNKKPTKCKTWDIDEFNELTNPDNWQREWLEQEKAEKFLTQLGVSKPLNLVRVARSGSSHPSDEIPPENKEIYGVDFFRKEEELRAYHFSFYQIGDKIVMPTKHDNFKNKEEHYITTFEEFEEKHNDSRNYN